MLSESVSTRIPPITAVPPSGIKTCVVADCDATDGMPLTARAKSGWLFVICTFSRIVPASVICGVTFNCRAKLCKLNRDRVVDVGLNRNLGSLLDRRRNVVLRRDMRTRDQPRRTSGFRRS